MEKILKNREGITLISLVVTVIILLILAGISIGMLSGDNGILGQAGNAKTQTEIEGEKEIINLAVVGAMNKSKYGDIDETYFTNELEKNNATVTKFGSKYKITFPSERQYTVDQDGNVKEKNPNALEISELNENASTYFGWDVINYAETLPTELQDTEWQLFYAGALDGETEERIYLISKKYIKNTDLPTVVKNGKEVEGAKPISGDNVYIASFGNSTSDGVMSQYNGSTNITDERLQKLNYKFFKYLKDNNLDNNYPNMRAVAYMMDTVTWRNFKGKYAEYAIGGTTIELLHTAYNKYKKNEDGKKYETQVIDSEGYKVRSRTSDDFGFQYSDKINNDTNEMDSPYSVYSLKNDANGYCLASPGAYINWEGERIIGVSNDGFHSLSKYKWNHYAFRPLVLLNSNYTLEKTKDLNGNDAFKIVEQ